MVTDITCTECGSDDVDTDDVRDRDTGDLATLECNDCGELMIARKLDPQDVFQ